MLHRCIIIQMLTLYEAFEFRLNYATLEILTWNGQGHNFGKQNVPDFNVLMLH